MSHTHPEQTEEVIDEEDNTIRCIHCKSEIVGKPWISVACGKDDVVHACNYICSNRLGFYIRTRRFFKNFRSSSAYA